MSNELMPLSKAAAAAGAAEADLLAAVNNKKLAATKLKGELHTTAQAVADWQAGKPLAGGPLPETRSDLATEVALLGEQLADLTQRVAALEAAKPSKAGGKTPKPD